MSEENTCATCQVCVQCEKMCGICITCEKGVVGQPQQPTLPVKPIVQRAPEINITDEQLKKIIADAVREGIRDALIELGWTPERKKKIEYEK